MTKKIRRTFSADFKMQAAALVLDQHYTITEACQAMSVGDTSLRRWVEQLQLERDGITPTAQAITPDQRRIQQLEAQIARLEMEKDILKKATALLMSDSIPLSHK